MQKLIKKTLLIILCLSFSAMIFLGCAENKSTENDTESPITVDTNTDSNDEVIIVEDGTIYFDGEEGNEAVFPSSYSDKTVTKIVDAQDEGVIYFENNAWNIAKNTTKERVSYNAKVYGENGTIIENAEIISAKKVISNEQDLLSLSGEKTDKIDGYFVVSNNINYEKVAIIKPKGVGDGSYSVGSTFIGTFDGDGHTIRYRLIRGGLFGNLSGATVKNAAFRVKEITPDGVDMTTDFGKYSILATYIAANTTIENIYAKYDCELEPNMEKIRGSNLYRGLGISCSNHKAKFKNVIVDLTNVKSFEPDLTIYGVSLGAVSGHTFGTAENTYVIWGNKEIYYNFPFKDRTPIYGVASNDADYDIPEGAELMVLTGIYRYDNLSAFASAVSKVGNFSITAEKIAWVK